jgi:hypothetical protein
MSGWIKLHRQLMESDLWISEPFDRGKAWVDILMLTNYKPGYIRSNGMKIAVNRGQLGWSEIRLSERWKWSRGKVRRFLSELETEQMIVQQKDRRKSLITICNYDEFQGAEPPLDTTDSTTDEQEADRKQDTIKKDKKGKKVVAPRFSPPTQTDVAAYMAEKGMVNGRVTLESEKFVDYYTSNGWKVGGKSAMKDWKASVRNWLKNIKQEQQPQQQVLVR